MSELFALFINNLLPIFLVAGAGYAVSRWLQLNPRTLSQLTFYIFSPVLIFDLLTGNGLGNGEMGRIMLFAAVTISLVGLVALLGSRLLKLERRLTAAVLLTSMFMNAGNLGLPLVLLAFGEAAMAYASVFFVTSALMTTTVGVIIASSGSVNLKQAFLNLLRVPYLYALLLALVFIRTGWELPAPLARTVGIVSGASVPTMLVLLGMQLHAAQWESRLKPLALVALIRLVVSPAIALTLGPAFGLAGAARQATIIESATPAAVLNTVVATEYCAEPSFVTAAVFVTTLLSPLTLVPLLAFLQAG